MHSQPAVVTLASGSEVPPTGGAGGAGGAGGGGGGGDGLPVGWSMPLWQPSEHIVYVVPPLVNDSVPQPVGQPHGPEVP
jgi:hypothetical protein